MPVLWFEQHVVASKNVVNIVKLVLGAPLAGEILGIIFVIIGTTLLLVSCCKRDQKETPSTNKSKTDFQKTSNLGESLPLVKN